MFIRKIKNCMVNMHKKLLKITHDFVCMYMFAFKYNTKVKKNKNKSDFLWLINLLFP